MFGNVNWYFLLTLQQKIEITDLNPFLADENTSVLIILATTICSIFKNSSLNLFFKVLFSSKRYLPLQVVCFIVIVSKAFSVYEANP